MLVVLPYSKPDYAQALKNAQWIGELGPYPGHDLLLVRDKLCEELPDEVVDGMGFGKVQQIVVVGDGWNKWPESPNLMFRSAAKHIEFTCAQPWFWLEADAVPLRKGWLDEIAAEYQTAGKPFLGDYVDIQGHPGFCPHMSGVGVYPGQMTRHAGEAMLAHEQAWDVVAANQIVPKMHKSKLIQHIVSGRPDMTNWKLHKFESLDQVRNEILPEAVIFHADKTGSAIDLLRAERDNLSVPVLADSPNPGSEPEQGASEAQESIQLRAEFTLPSNSRGAQNFTCDIFIKSYPPDYGWLEYCLRSIDKFCTGFRRVVIVAPDENCPRPKVLPNILKVVPEQQPGYNWQQVVKISADQFTDASHVLFMDSDCIVTRPVTPQTFMHEEKIFWLMTPFEKAREDQKRAWIPVMTKWMGKTPEFEFMRRHPFMFPRWLCEKVRDFCVFKHGRTLEQYVLEQGEGLTFSEFNCSGFLAYEQFQDQFEWLNTDTGQIPEETVLQKWSRGGLTNEIKAEFETILSSGVESRNAAWKAVEGKKTESPEPNPHPDYQTPCVNGRMQDSGSSAPPAQAIRQTKEGWWIIDGDQWISKWVEETGRLDHDQNLLPSILPHIPEGGVVVDAGANIGSHTITYLEKVGESGRVLAIEPNEDAWDCLRRNCPRAMIRGNTALWDKQKKLRLVKDANAGASFVEEDEQGDITGFMLDTLIKGTVNRVDLIKLDCEGSEVRALLGAEKTIAKYRPKLVIEVNQAALQRQGTDRMQLLAWLETRGYINEILQDNCTQESPMYDLLCLPIEKVADGSASPDSSTLTSAKLNEIADSLGGAIKPWDSNAETIGEIKRLSARLKSFCTAPAYIRRVRDELALAGVVKKK